METIQILFWVSIGILVYTYFGYGLTTYVWSKLKGIEDLPQLSEEDLPEVTHLIAAYNEEDLIEEKILNSRKQNYPQHKLKTIIVADGSTDSTASIVQKYPFVKLYYSPERKGKLAAVNRVMKEVDTPITVFSDANSMLNTDAIKKMVNHFQLNSVGAVAGEKVVINKEQEDAAGAGEGIYWKYESWLKKLDYKVHSVVGAAGELFAVRTHLYESPKQNSLIEDFIVTMNIAAKGYRVAYESEARASETSSANVDEEMKRKVRISAGGLQSVWMLRALLNPLKYGVLSFQYVSHRAMRWTLAPVALGLAFMLNIALAREIGGFYSLTMTFQFIFYLAAIIGFHFEGKKMRFKAFFVPFYFAFMNLSVYLGFFMLASGKFDVKWSKAQRKVYHPISA